MKILKFYILLSLGLVILSFKLVSGYLISYQLHDQIIVKYKIEPTDDLISPYKATRIALMNVFAINIKVVWVLLDTYPEMNITSPTYSVELTMNLNSQSHEGEIISVKVA